jgi:hypothetical protein
MPRIALGSSTQQCRPKHNSRQTKVWTKGEMWDRTAFIVP